jgi:hypothetical protein
MQIKNGMTKEAKEAQKTLFLFNFKNFNYFLRLKTSFKQLESQKHPHKQN